MAGVRLIHLHTTQMKDINDAIQAILDEQKYQILEDPVAMTWEDENKKYFQSLGLKIRSNESMYTSIHYIIAENSKTKRRIELQVRTLMEEVWGEVSHTINYPHETESVPCREQLKVLARIANSGSRLVDSIFASHKDHLTRTAKPRKRT